MKKLFLLILILVPLSTFAADAYTLLEPLPCIENTGQTCENGLIKQIDTKTYLSYVYKFSIAFAAVAAVVLIMYAGFEYATTDIIGNKAEAKKRIQNALLGLVTLLCSYLILQTIDPRLVEIDTQLKPIGLSGQTFNYNDLVMTANDYAVKKSLDQALTSSKIYLGEAEKLERDAAAIRAERGNAQSPEEIASLESRAAALENEALDLRIKAKSTTASAAADARYKLFLEGADQYNLEKNNSNSDMKELYEMGSAQIIAGMDKSIKEITAIGGPAAAAEFEERKAMYLDLYKNEIEARRAIEKYKDFTGSLPLQQKARVIALTLSSGGTLKDINLDTIQDTSYVPAPTFSNPDVQAEYIKKKAEIIKQIQDSVPPLKQELEQQNNPAPTQPTTP